MQQPAIYSAAQSVFHSSKRGFVGPALFALGLFGLGTSVAFASGMEISAPGLLRTAMTAGAVASPAEIKNFAAAVRGIKPLNEQVHSALSQKGITATKREELKKSYMARVNSILASNHLTAEQYTSMLKQTQDDPAFARQVEGAMQ
ncbi:DUF4168 domain-containing protein [Acidithiobacillus ferrivorans]|uniref:DUF4168 domain-containing protein n=1 Tax=Acidithiobacillus ferrivorans TaxID=160808 RepID=UPI001C07BC74|nr:DUF4168 domain-containing protein [Acidithiobacillus ferrivorans]MBU2849753.1 DUF4168 domain-containing protein [Acidithiobacillus ferrivorans]